ncbi:MAG: hypothetical protein M3R66_17530, partial [Actinomycetota bacterium]|nr:hypothetical protein [Actinomycetota bacterium]
MTSVTPDPTHTAKQERGSAVVVDGLHRRYAGPSGYEAVRGVSFTVDSGEVFALLGTNGAGRTKVVLHTDNLSSAVGKLGAT